MSKPPFTSDDPPKFWQFKGHIAADTYFELQVVGRPNAKALRNLIKQVELTAMWLEDDEAGRQALEAKTSPPASTGEGGEP